MSHRRRPSNSGIPAPQIRLSKTYTSGLANQDVSNKRSGLHLYPEEAPLPPLLLVPEDALDRKRQADSRGLSSAGPAKKKSFGSFSLFIPGLAPKQSSLSTLSQPTAAATSAASVVEPPLLSISQETSAQVDQPMRRVSKIPESISLQTFKKATKRGVFKSAKEDIATPSGQKRASKGPEADIMERRDRKIRQSASIEKLPTVNTRSKHISTNDFPSRYTPDTLRRRLGQPLPPLPTITAHYAAQQQQRLQKQEQLNIDREPVTRRVQASQIPEMKPMEPVRRRTTLEEDLKAWKAKYATIATVPTSLPHPDTITEDRKNAIAATLNSLKIFKRQSTGTEFQNLTLTTDEVSSRRSDASSNRTLVSMFSDNSLENIAASQSLRLRDRRYRGKDFGVSMCANPTSSFSNQFEDMDAVKLQHYREMVSLSLC